MRTTTYLFFLAGKRLVAACPLLLAACPLLLGSCSQSEDTWAGSGSAEGQVPITVEASIAQAVMTGSAIRTVTARTATSRMAMTRAEGDTEDYTPVPDGGSIGIFRTAPVTTDSPAQYDVKYTYSATDGGKWSPTDPTKQITVGGADATLCGYYSTETVTFGSEDGTKTVTTLTAKKYTAGKELWYAASPQTAVNNAQRQVNFQMVHAYSRVQLHITRSTAQAYLGDCKVSGVKLEPETPSNDFYTARTLNIALAKGAAGQLGGTTTANWTLDTNTNGWSMYKDGLTAGTSNTEIDYLFPPQAFTPSVGLKLTMTIDDNALEVIIPYSKLPGFTAGTVHVIKLEIQGITLKLTSVSKQAWTEVPVKGGEGKDKDYETH